MVLAWIILPITLVITMTGSAPPAQVSTRTANSSITQVILTSTLSTATAPVPTAGPAARYAVQAGDTLSAIAARFAVHGGWPVLYAANRHTIGPDPDVLHPGTVLVLPRQAPPARYAVTAGDTLSGIAAEFAIPAGWPALYAANRHTIGPDPDTIHPGMVLTLPHPPAPAAPPGRSHRRHPAPPARPAGPHHHPRPAATSAPAATGMPHWLETMLLALGLVVVVSFIAEPAVAARRRRQHTAARAGQPGQASTGQRPCSWPPGPERSSIVLADHDQLVVTRSKHDDTIYVLRPPGEDPREILRVACLVLPEGLYGELARQLGMPDTEPAE